MTAPDRLTEAEIEVMRRRVAVYAELEDIRYRDPANNVRGVARDAQRLLAEIDALRAELATASCSLSVHIRLWQDGISERVKLQAELSRVTAERDAALDGMANETTARVAAETERDELSSVLADLVTTLPKCDECTRPATRAFRRGEGRWCDEHGERWLAGYKHPVTAPEYPRATALRRAEALLAERLGERKAT